MSSLTAHTTKEVDTQNRDMFDKGLSFLQPQNYSKSRAPWLVDTVGKPLKSKNHPNSGVSQLSIHHSESISKRFGDLGLSLTADHSLAPSKNLDPTHFSGEKSGHGPSSSDMNASYSDEGNSSGESLRNLRTIQTSASDQLDLNGLLHTADASDETSGSRRMGSTSSKLSGLSSHTSAEPSYVKDEMDENDASFSTLNDPSSLSSVSSQLSPAKSTTPVAIKPPTKDNSAKQHRKLSKVARLRFSDLRPRTSIPSNMYPTDLAQQSIHAAYSSRLNPFALHPDEYQLLRAHISHLHVTAYLNIRNRILRLWVRNPLVSVTPEEAAGCSLSSRWLGLAEVAYEFLVRKGYINFGCVEIPNISNGRVNRYKLKRAKRKTVVVVGAGMAGLGCARQLEGLFSHYQARWTSIGEEPPRVLVLEGRNRIGGRVYSHPLQGASAGIPKQSRCTAEMGAHIITGFDHGNPLSMIIRGQLALPYYPLKDNSTLYDLDGHVVDKDRDMMVEKLYNDVLDRASVYRHRVVPPRTAAGDKQLIEAGRDPTGEVGLLMSATESQHAPKVPEASDAGPEPVPGGMDKLTGKAHMVSGSRTKAPPAMVAEAMGWRLASNVLAFRDMNLDAVAKSTYPTLGAAMDEAVKQYQFLLDLSPQDMRLLNWHYANLEYANAVNVGKLSLGGWDQDIGNEFEGEHAQVIGGYQQVPRGIWQYPYKLDLRTRKAVTRIAYDPGDGPESTARVLCEDGEVLEANQIVLTAPLGILKNDSIAFAPALPSWKTAPIQRLGFGVLNKVILVYEKPFWNVDQDMFGLLREPEVPDSLDQEDYVSNRGRFYLFWNCIKTSGLPVLIALMAGDAAHQAELISDATLVASVTQELARMFKQTALPKPIETIVTRWGKDRFARGSYSYVGATSEPGDYDAMARPIGNLHFAGEATCGTHPATVHGAYISGLRAASEVIDAMLGDIGIPSPLVAAPSVTGKLDSPKEIGQKRKADGPALEETHNAKQARLDAFESEILGAIFRELGYRPSKPGKPGSNPFLLFTKDQWASCKKVCDEARRVATGNPEAKAARNEVRSALGLMWREASDEVKKPYVEQTNTNRVANIESAATFQDRLAGWDEKAMDIRRSYVEQHPGVLSKGEELEMWQALGGYGGGDRRAKKMSGYAEESGSDVEMGV